MRRALARRLRHRSGFSLVELMVAMLIGLVLLLGVVQIFAASHSAYLLSQGMSRIQENGRFAMDYLARDIRMVGHMGCNSDVSRVYADDTSDFLSTYTTFADTAVPALQFNYAIQGYEATSSAPGASITLAATPATGGTYSPSLPTQLSTVLSNRVAGSDILVLRYLDAQGVPLSSAVSSSAGAVLPVIATTADWTLLKGGLDNPGLFGITNCASARIFHASAVTTTSSSATVTVAATTLNSALSSASFDFGAGARLYRAESEVYYVGLNSSSRPSLYRVRFIATPGGSLTSQMEELVEGIESMQLLYGQSASSSSVPSGALSTLQTASNIGSTEAAWRRVLNVQVGLVAASPDAVSAAQAQSSNALIAQGITFTAPSDGRARGVYQSTITLRNRLYGN
jgi:type IV pilus assembly protein PilW